MSANILHFPESDSIPSLASCKVQLLEVLREVLTNEPQCFLRAPVDVLEIYKYRVPASEMGPKNPLRIWVRAAYELERDGLTRVWRKLGKTFLELTEKGKMHVLGMALGCGPLPPDYEGDAGDETAQICALPFDEHEQVSCGTREGVAAPSPGRDGDNDEDMPHQSAPPAGIEVSGERATSQATAETDVSAEGQRHRAPCEVRSVPSLPAHRTANGTESRYVDPELRAMTSPAIQRCCLPSGHAGRHLFIQSTRASGFGECRALPDANSPRTVPEIAGVLAARELEERAARRCGHCREEVPLGHSIYWRGMLFHLEQGRDCRMDFIVAKADKIDHRSGEFSKEGA